MILVCGASASGKTTLLRLLKPMVAPAGSLAGSIELAGDPIEGMPVREQASRIGFVMQDPDAQICTDDVLSELAFGLESLGVDRERMRSRIAEVAQFFGMASILHSKTSELSGGQKQLLNLASAVISRPEVLLLDEPMAQLDPIARESFLSMLVKVNKELGVTVVLSEHHLDDVMDIVDEALFLDQGEVAAVGTPDEVASFIFDSRRDLSPMLPAPAEVFLALKAREGGGVAFDRPIPFSVRDARGWLRGYAASRELPDHRDASLMEAASVDPSYAKERADLGSSECAIRLQDVWFRYERNAPDVLRVCSLEIASRRITALVGGNGSGKTTLLKVLGARVKPYMGAVFVFDEGKRSLVRASSASARTTIAHLPQDPTLIFDSDTVSGEIADPGVLHEWGIHSLDGLLDADPFDLSGGQRQLLALAKVLLTDADILLLDEPTKGMDIALRSRVQDVLRKECERGRTIVMATHDLDLAARCADIVAMVFDGALTTILPTRRFFVENLIYTTASRRLSAGIIPDAITPQEVISACGAE